VVFDAGQVDILISVMHFSYFNHTTYVPTMSRTSGDFYHLQALCWLLLLKYFSSMLL